MGGNTSAAELPPWTAKIRRDHPRLFFNDQTWKEVQALAQGYQTESKDFTAVVGVMLAIMDHVENVPGQGYRLKKR